MRRRCGAIYHLGGTYSRFLIRGNAPPKARTFAKKPRSHSDVAHGCHPEHAEGRGCAAGVRARRLSGRGLRCGIDIVTYPDPSQQHDEGFFNSQLGLPASADVTDRLSVTGKHGGLRPVIVTRNASVRRGSAAGRQERRLPMQGRPSESRRQASPPVCRARCR